MEKDPKHFADLIIFEGFPMAQWKKTLPAVLEMQKAQFNPYVGKIPREEEIATLSRILAWGISWTEEPGRLQSMGA